MITGAGPVGALAAIYAARRDYVVEVYESRDGTYVIRTCLNDITFNQSRHLKFFRGTFNL